MKTRAELTIDLAHGDPSAFRDIFNLFYPRMVDYCKLFIQDHSLAEDLVQDCFIQLWNKRKKLDPNKNVDRLLFVMLHNRCLNYLRDNRLDNSILELTDQNINQIQLLYQIDFTGEEDVPLEEQLRHSLKEVIENLPGKQKEVFIRTKIDGKGQKEVAKEMGVTVKAIEKHISLAKKRIKKELSRKFPFLLPIILILFP